MDVIYIYSLSGHVKLAKLQCESDLFVTLEHVKPNPWLTVVYHDGGSGVLTTKFNEVDRIQFGQHIAGDCLGLHCPSVLYTYRRQGLRRSTGTTNYLIRCEGWSGSSLPVMGVGILFSSVLREPVPSDTGAWRRLRSAWTLAQFSR